jgi:hypothetical protein
LIDGYMHQQRMRQDMRPAKVFIVTYIKHDSNKHANTVVMLFTITH